MTRLLKPIIPVLLMTFGLAALTGCNQRRYEPAQWRAASRESTTLPDQSTGAPDSRWARDRLGMTNWLGSTLPGRGSTLPGRGWTTLPERGWTTLPSRGWTTLPQRGTTLPGRGTTLPIWRNRWDTLPSRGTTLPESEWSRLRTPQRTTLPGR